MRVVELNAENWHGVIDYYDALKAALGSCRGHGSSPDSRVDSMIYGGMNDVEPPYVIRIVGTSKCNDELKREISLLADVIRDARAWRLENYGDDVDVSFAIEP